MLLYALELSILLGLAFIFFRSEPESDQAETTDTQEKPKLPQNTTQNPWLQKIVIALAKMRGDLSPRISSDSCCICYEDIKNEVQSSCGHIFCGHCLLKLWKHNEEKKLNCPLCRRDINMITCNLSKDKSAQNSVMSDIKEQTDIYNAEFSSQKHLAEQLYSDIQNLFTKSISSLIKKKLFTSCGQNIVIALGIVFVGLSTLPSLFNPSSATLINWIENVVLVAFSYIYVSSQYNKSEKNKEEQEQDQFI